MARKKVKTKKPKETPRSFEESLEHLRETVGQLENGNLTLSEALEMYEKGVSSLKECYQALNSVQQRIELLVDLDEDGNLITRSFDNTSSDQMTDGTRRKTSPSTSGPAEDEFDDEEEFSDEYEEDGADGDDYDTDEDVDDPNSLF